MGTKLKKSKFYSQTFKALAVTAILCWTVVGCISGFSLLDFKNGGMGFTMLRQGSYFYTDVFYNQYNQLVRDVVNVNLAYKNEENVKEGGALDAEQLMRSFSFDYDIPEEMLPYLLYAEEHGVTEFDRLRFDNLPALEQKSRNDFHVVSDSLDVERTENWQEDPEAVLETEAGLQEEDARRYFQVYKDGFTRFKQRVIQEQLVDFKASQEDLDQYINFGYYLVNNETQEVISNMPAEEIKKQEVYSIVDGPYIEGYQIRSTNEYYFYNEYLEQKNRYWYDNYLDSVQDILQKNNTTLYVGIPQPLAPGDNFYAQHQTFQAKLRQVPHYIGLMSISALICAVLMCYLIVAAGRHERGGEVVLRGIDKIFVDVQTIFVLFVTGISAVITVFTLGLLMSSGLNDTENWSIALQIFLIGLTLFNVCVWLSYLTSLSRQIKAHQFFYNTVFGAFFRKVGSLVAAKSFKSWIVFCALCYVAINLSLFLLLLSSWSFGGFMLFGLLLLVFNVFSLSIFLKMLSSLSQIMRAVKETSKGNLSYYLNMKKMSPSLVPFAKDVNGLQNGLKNAVEEAVKSERMKADLITNVSHDLKTPLTSIVTYVDLLKKEELENETAKGYVQVLDEKSDRLKQLIEDLIEASKVSSGNISVQYEKVDLRQLVMQASGEFEEKIKKAALNFRVTSSGQTYIRADGKHMWRIVENLISNAIKYSMPNTRVYIDIIKTEEMGIFIIKNMSAQLIEVRPDQLTDRFVRGQSSRTTEGSGLGLSIAKSLTNIQGGTMEIAIDGDLFKVAIRMPMWKEKPKPIAEEKAVQEKPEDAEKKKLHLKKKPVGESGGSL